MAGIGKFVGCLSRGFQRSKLAGDSKSRVRRFPLGNHQDFLRRRPRAEACKRRFGFSDATWTAAICRGEITPRPRTTQRPPGERRRAVANLLDQGLGIAEIARKLGVSKPTVCYHARKLGVPSRREFARRFDWGEISRVYESGVAMRECRRRFGFSSQAWADAVRRGDITPRSRLLPFDALLVVGRRTNRTHLKGRLLAEGLKHNRCEQCGITEWQRKPLSMQLHHVNGDGTTIDSRTSFSSAPTVTARPTRTVGGTGTGGARLRMWKARDHSCVGRSRAPLI